MHPIFFETPEVFRAWLNENHNKATELLVGFYKVKSGKPSMTWSQSVDQALCFGWIDGIRKSIDKDSYCIRFTPRKKNSIWSAVNIDKVEALLKSGLMYPEGLKAYGFKTESKSKIYSHENENIALDSHFEEQFKHDKAAYDFFIHQASSYQKVVIHWIMSAKQEKTRKSRLAKTIAASGQLKRLE
jgi:uncharacterized protein YdeI (YjbR/CyaY-like superfamily)